MRKLLVLVLLILTFLLGATMSFHNKQPVEVNYLVGSVEHPLGLLLVAVAAASICIMALLYVLLSLPKRAETARLRRRLDKAETELSNLRKLPLQDG